MSIAFLRIFEKIFVKNLCKSKKTVSHIQKSGGYRSSLPITPSAISPIMVTTCSVPYSEFSAYA